METGEHLATLTPDTADAVGSRVPLPEVESPLLRDAIAMWDSKKDGRHFPTREALSPRDMTRFLRHVTLYRITPDGADFEYRVMGDAAVQAWGHNFVGYKTADLNKLQAGMGDVIQRLCNSIVRHREPLLLRGVLSKGSHEHIAQETAFLPLGPDDETVDHILSVSWYVPRA